MWGDGSDNTTRKRLRKLEQAGSVKKDGKYWQVDVNAIPLNPTHYWKPPQTPHYAAD